MISGLGLRGLLPRMMSSAEFAAARASSDFFSALSDAAVWGILHKKIQVKKQEGESVTMYVIAYFLVTSNLLGAL